MSRGIFKGLLFLVAYFTWGAFQGVLGVAEGDLLDVGLAVVEALAG